MDKLKLKDLGYNQNQQGFILLTALAFMIVLTIIVLTTVNISSSDEKIARNSRDKDIAFAAASAALRDAELYVSGSYFFPYNLNNRNPANYWASCATIAALCDLRNTSLTVPVDQLDLINGDTRDGGIANQSNVIGTTTGSPQIKGNISAQPHYLVEVVDDPSTPPCIVSGSSGIVFRITAQGQGRLATTRSTLQEFYCPPN